MVRLKYFSLLVVICLLSACGKSREVVESDSEITLAERYSTIPDFSEYSDVKEKKTAFFDFLRPMVREENARIIQSRSRLKSIFTTSIPKAMLDKEDSIWLMIMAEKFKLHDLNYNLRTDREELLSRMDAIPESLFLAQAANESAWGTSRFARTANNLFGQWCFSKGCGIVPSQRAPGERHEVQKFVTVNAAVASYVLNLNSHPAYEKLRVERLRIKRLGKIPTGFDLAIGLEKYSARGLEYVKEIRSMISFNQLESSPAEYKTK